MLHHSSVWLSKQSEEISAPLNQVQGMFATINQLEVANFANLQAVIANALDVTVSVVAGSLAYVANA